MATDVQMPVSLFHRTGICLCQTCLREFRTHRQSQTNLRHRPVPAAGRRDAALLSDLTPIDESNHPSSSAFCKPSRCRSLQFADTRIRRGNYLGWDLSSRSVELALLYRTDRPLEV